MQLRIHMGRCQQVPGADITTYYLGTMIGNAFPFFLNKKAAQDMAFTTVMAFTDPGVDAFTIQVSGGEVTVRPGGAGTPDLVITQFAETFGSTTRGIQTMPDALEAGAVQVDKPGALATFGEMFPVYL